MHENSPVHFQTEMHRRTEYDLVLERFESDTVRTRRFFT